MLLDLLKPVTDHSPPFTSVCLDATRMDRATQDDVDLRWAEQRRTLESLGAPDAALDALGERATEPTGRGGEHARVLVASGDRVVLDLVLPGRPAREEAWHGAIAQLMPVARALSRAVPHAVVRVDRAGADIEVIGLLGEVEAEQEVTGGHDVLHKVPGGGWSQRRYLSRVEDSWEHNAATVAEELDRIVRRHRPEVVLIAGDTNAIAALEEHAGHELAERLVHLQSGGRAAGISEAAEQDAIDHALAEQLTRRRQALYDRLNEQLSRQQEAVEGLDAVVEVLRRGQVDELLLRDDPTSTIRLWVGEKPLQIGTTRADAVAAGAERPEEVRADAAITWALVGSSAGITLVDDEAGPTLADGIGALLRWSDPATPHSAAPSMPGHGEPPGMPANQQ